MEDINAKKTLISNWVSGSPPTWGPALASYIKRTEKGVYGAFKIDSCNRSELIKECIAHIDRLLSELNKRFSRSPVQESLTVLFDPRYLIEHKKDIASPDYGRSSLGFLRDKYKGLREFDSNAVRSEWETLKPTLADFVNTSATVGTQEGFWNQFLLLRQSLSDQFLGENQNILLLLSIYLISPTNSAECERGVS